MDGTELKNEVVDICRQYALDVDGRDAEDAERHKQWLRLTEQRLVTGLFRIVVMGEIKKGKSSAINALLDVPDLVPTSSDIATSTVFKIVYGKKRRYSVFLQPPETPSDDDASSMAPAPIEISSERRYCEELKMHVTEVEMYGTERGNPDNCRNVDFILVELPHPMLERGIVFIDTPGVGGLFKKHRDITFKYAPNADAVLFVLDSAESLIGRDELDFLKELRKITRHIHFVQTKIDAADEATWLAWKDRNIELLSKELSLIKTDIRYFPISSSLKVYADAQQDKSLLDDSGFVPLLTFLTDTLLPQKDRLLAETTAREVLERVVADGRLLNDQMRITRDMDAAQLHEYKSSLERAQREATAWEIDVWRPRQEAYADGVAALKHHTQRLINESFSSDSDEFQSMIKSLRMRFKDADEVAVSSNRAMNDYAAACSAKARVICDDFYQGVLDLYVRTLEKNAEDLDRTINVAVDGIRARDTAPIPRAGRFDAIRAATMSSNAMGQIAGIGTAGLGYALGLGIIGGPIAVGAAAAAGIAYVTAKLWGAVKGYQSSRQTQLVAALAELERGLHAVARQGQRATQNSYSELVFKCDRMARDGFREYFASRKGELSARLDTIASSQRTTSEERRQLVSLLDARMTRLGEVNARLRTALGQPVTTYARAATAVRP